jgi:hypothetical protein
MMSVLLLRWAAQEEFNSSRGDTSFRTTAAIFDGFSRWITDDANDVCCNEEISHESVKARLHTLYRDQLRRGDRNGLQHRMGAGNHELWNFTANDPSRPIGSDGARFEREMVKLVFAMLDTTCEVVAASNLELTPAQRVRLQPSSVTQIAYALADVCAGAPDFVTLCTVARDVITNELARRDAQHSGRDSAPSASSGRASKLQRQECASPNRSAAHSPAAFSPHLTTPSADLSLHDQVLCYAMPLDCL